MKLSLLLPAVMALAVPLRGAEPLQKNILKLVSPVTAERQAGEAWLTDHGDKTITDLIAQLETGDWKQQSEATHTLMLLVSPWQRGVETGKRHHGQIELFRPNRPTGRPVDHPQAPQLRKVLLDTLTKTLQTIDREPATEKGYTTYSNLGAVIQTGTAALAEVADDETARAIRDLLKKEKDPTLGLSLMHGLETIYGLPTYFHQGGLCGVGLTPEIVRKHREDEARAFEAKKKELLEWLDKHGKRRAAERVDAAIAVWVERAAENPTYSVSRGNGSSILTLTRLGDAAVPGLRKQQGRETTLKGRAFFEVVAATITGKVDDKLVRELIDVKNLNDRDLHQFACEIIALSGSPDYQKELEALLGDPRYSGLDVARTLAIVHRHAALPVLRKQPKSNYVAACAVKELESWPE